MSNEAKSSHDRAPKQFVFVLMPFSDDFRDVYRLGIKAACEKVGAYCERVDEQFFNDTVLQRIYNQIAKADLIIADMTGRNPNVFYEVGYAHALGKEVVLQTRSVDDIPFDLKHHPHIIYEGSVSSLLDQLVPRLDWSLGQLRSHGVVPDLPALKFFVAGQELSKGEEVMAEVPSPRSESGETSFQIDIHNPSGSIIELQEGALALVSTADSGVSLGTTDRVTLPEGKEHYTLPLVGQILPRSWRVIQVSIFLDRVSVEELSDNTDDDAAYDPYQYLQFEKERRLEFQLVHYRPDGVMRTTAVVHVRRPPSEPISANPLQRTT